jgi:hypothetical protein
MIFQNKQKGGIQTKVLRRVNKIAVENIRKNPQILSISPACAQEFIEYSHG